MKKRWIAIVMAVQAITWLGCESEEEPEPVDCNVNPVVATLATVTDAQCNLTDGSIEVTASGGSGKYRFGIGDAPPTTSPVFNGLGAGVYEIVAIDDNGCEGLLEVSVKNSAGMNVTFEATPSGCKTSNGMLTVNAVDGTAPYQFKLGTGSFTTNPVFSDLPAGEYDLVVNDASGCEVSQHLTVGSGVSYSATVSGIIKNNCAVSGCHAGTQAPDFRVFKNIHDNAAQIKTLTGNRTMPQNGTLSQEQIDLIGCWVDDGALEN